MHPSDEFRQNDSSPVPIRPVLPALVPPCLPKCHRSLFAHAFSLLAAVVAAAVGAVVVAVCFSSKTYIMHAERVSNWRQFYMQWDRA